MWRIKLHPYQLICLFEFPENVLSKNRLLSKVLVSNSIDNFKFKCNFIKRISVNRLLTFERHRVMNPVVTNNAKIMVERRN